MLVQKAIDYKCETFAIENLNIKSSDKQKGKRFNRLCNNQWNRRALVDSIRKRCNLNSMNILELDCRYSSFWGNILFRKHNLPDMILASVEISRRCFEFSHQYNKKDIEKRKCIVRPDFNDFKDEFEHVLGDLKLDLKCNLKTYSKFYEYIKKNKISYRVSIDKFNDVEKSKVDFSEFIKEILFDI